MSSAPAYTESPLHSTDLPTPLRAIDAQPAKRPVLKIQGAKKVYEHGDRHVVAFSDVNLSLHPGEIICLLGPSGCGKSSLLRAAAGLDHLSEGEIEIHGQALDGPDPRIGVVFQDARLLPWLTVRENIAFPFRFAANNGTARRGWRRFLPSKPANDTSNTEVLSREAIDARVDEILEQTGLSGFADAYPAKISGGMAQRVSLARTLVRSPEIILCDEPFAALDALLRMELQEWFVRLVREQGASLVFVTHDIEEALYLGDRIAVLTPHPGNIAEVRDVDLPRPRDRESRTFFEHRSSILQTFKRLQVNHLSK